MVPSTQLRHQQQKQKQLQGQQSRNRYLKKVEKEEVFGGGGVHQVLLHASQDRLIGEALALRLGSIMLQMYVCHLACM